jgi:hypothetical protein
VPRLIGDVTLEGRPCLAFESDARCDLHQLATSAAQRNLPIDVDAAAGFSIAVLETLDAVHRATGRCVGALSAGNVMVASDGRFQLLGFGHPVGSAERARLLGAMPPSFVAPEVALGATPLPGSDLLAALSFFHSFLGLGELPEAVRRGLQGEATAGLDGLPAQLAELFALGHGPRPETRSIPRFVALYREILARLSIEPDGEAFERMLAAIAAGAAGTNSTLEITGDGRMVRIGDGPPINLTRRGTQRRLLLALAHERVHHPGVAINWQVLFERGWPGEQSAPESARARVYVVIAALRSHGLRERLHTSDEGYFLDPEMQVTLRD